MLWQQSDSVKIPLKSENNNKSDHMKQTGIICQNSSTPEKTLAKCLETDI